ncbi:MAG: AAA family ATPase, partial [Schwartzia sp.]|nr:AAA family ATPase [Schwartzia sp. (in: firmicutes)]
MKRLEAYGFKSFADKIEIEFDHGVTAIVGPNGSGKSNITDAIRWVLGERNVRNLRGTKTEDIIFAGSSERRSLGAAEVSLTLLNQGDLPGNFDEIVITRRIFRSGDSEFLLNNTRCHLKDIYEMLADTGLGRDGLSVISQNKIDAVLNSRPEERRLFFEETAGITKFRDRKVSAVRKLEEAEKNLVRLGDIRQGLEDQLGPMAEAAERTKQYNVWNGELRRCKITELFRAQREMGEKEQASRERFAACQQEETEAASKLITLEAEKETLAKTLIDLQQEGQRKFEERNAQQEKISNKETEIRVLEERRQNSDETQRALKEKREALQTGLADAEKALSNLREGEKEALKAQEEAEQKLTEAQENVNRIFEELKTRRQARDELSARFSETQKDFLTKQGELGSLEQNLITSRETRQRQEQEIREGEKRLGENQEKLDALSKKIGELEEEQQALLTAQKQTEAKRRGIEKLQKERRQTISIARTYIDQTEGKREILQQSIEAYEGFGNAAKAVLTANEPWKNGVCGAVAELIDVPKQYLTATEAALGSALQNIVTRDADAA